MTDIGIYKEDFKTYAELKIQAKDLNEQISSLGQSLIEIMENAKKDKVELTDPETGELVGSFTVTPYRTWKFSSKVNELEQQLKDLKAEEQANGVAEVSEKPSLRFTENKKKEEEF